VRSAPPRRVAARGEVRRPSERVMQSGAARCEAWQLDDFKRVASHLYASDLPPTVRRSLFSFFPHLEDVKPEDEDGVGGQGIWAGDGFWVGTWGRGFRCSASVVCFSFKNAVRAA
jgi:hypothetical protein